MVRAREIVARLGIAELWTPERPIVEWRRAASWSRWRAPWLAPPRVLLLSTSRSSTLDPRRRARVRREVGKLYREQDMTVLQVTHDFGEAGMLGDIAVLLDGGRVLKQGRPTRCFAGPRQPISRSSLGAENVYTGMITRAPAAAAPDRRHGHR